MVGHLDHIKVKFKYQGHWVKVKVTLVNGLFGLLDTKLFSYDQLTVLIYQGQVRFKVKVLPGSR